MRGVSEGVSPLPSQLVDLRELHELSPRVSEAEPRPQTQFWRHKTLLVERKMLPFAHFGLSTVWFGFRILVRLHA